MRVAIWQSQSYTESERKSNYTERVAGEINKSSMMETGRNTRARRGSDTVVPSSFSAQDAVPFQC